MIETFDDSSLLDGLDENQKQLLKQLNQEKEKLLKSFKTKQISSIEERQSTVRAFDSFLKESLTSKDEKLKEVDIMIIDEKMTTFCKDINAKVIQLSPSELKIAIKRYNNYIDDKIEAEHKQENKEFVKSINGQEDYKEFMKLAKSLLRTTDYCFLEHNLNVFGNFCQQLKKTLFNIEDKNHYITCLYSSHGGYGKTFLMNIIKETMKGVCNDWMFDIKRKDIKLAQKVSCSLNAFDNCLYKTINNDGLVYKIAMNKTFNYNNKQIKSKTNIITASNRVSSNKLNKTIYFYDDADQQNDLQYHLKDQYLNKKYSGLLLSKEEGQKIFLNCLKTVPLNCDFNVDIPVNINESCISFNERKHAYISLKENIEKILSTIK